MKFAVATHILPTYIVSTEMDYLVNCVHVKYFRTIV